MDQFTAHLPTSTADFHVQAVPLTSSQPQPGLSGCWKLVAGKALTLRARQAGRMRVAHGRIWLTFKLAAVDARVRSGDHFLGMGQWLDLRAGESVVMESFSGEAEAAVSAYFTWDPIPVISALAIAHSPWRQNLHQPLADLRLALGLGAAALARLARGLTLALVG